MLPFVFPFGTVVVVVDVAVVLVANVVVPVVMFLRKDREGEFGGGLDDNVVVVCCWSCEGDRQAEEDGEGGAEEECELFLVAVGDNGGARLATILVKEVTDDDKEVTDDDIKCETSFLLS